MSASITALFFLCLSASPIAAHPGLRNPEDLRLVGRQSNPPSGVLPDDFANHPWIPQQAGELRAPCPALNTLANHGYLNRNGSGITAGDLSAAFEAGFGVGQSVIETAITNAFAVCEIETGSQCSAIDLSQLNRPFAFEHDHSFSRQDFLMIWGSDINNFKFNRTIFGNTLQALDGALTADILQFDEARLVRESNAYVIDGAGNFRSNYFTQLEEIGFIFSVMRNFNETRNGVPIADPNNQFDQTIQIDWWMYWFSREEFPVALGWLKPSATVEAPYVTTIRSSIFSASATSSPTPSAPGVASSLTTQPLQASGPGKRAVTTTHAGSAVASTSATPTPVSSLPLPISPLISLPNIETIVTLLPTQLSKINSELAAATITPPTPLLPYQIPYHASDFASYSSAVMAFQSAFTSVAEKVIHA